MKKQITTVLLIFCLIAFCAAAVLLSNRRSFLGCGIISAEKAERYGSIEQEFEGYLSLQEKTLPKSKEKKTVYLPQNLNTSHWDGALTARKGRVLFVQDEYMAQKEKSIAENHEFAYLVISAEGELLERGNLVCTGLPALCWRTDTGVNWAELDSETESLEFSGSMTLFDPKEKNYSVQTAKMESHIRGVTSRYADKKSYKMKLFDPKGQKQNLSLCSLRSDNSWNLNAMFGDGSLIREKTGWQVWNEICDTNSKDLKGSDLCYVELFADDCYLGVYLLQEPVDSKQLQLSDQDVLYKSGGNTLPDAEIIDYIYSESWKDGWYEITADGNYYWTTADTFYEQNPLFIKIDKHVTNLKVKNKPEDLEDAWEPLRQFVSVLHDPDSDLAAVDRVADRSNLIDMNLFRQTLLAFDNRTRNTYYLAQQNDNGWKLTLIPWDLDGVLGNGYEIFRGEQTLLSCSQTIMGRDRFYDDPYEDETKLPAAALREVGVEPIQDRWEQLKNGPLSADRICEILTENHAFLNNSGAAARNNERWPKRDGNASCEELVQFVRMRAEALDRYYSDLTVESLLAEEW